LPTGDGLGLNGGKAGGLARLNGIARVPKFAVLRSEWIAANEVRLEASIGEILQAAPISPPYAVRSSASDEDGVDSAFAGMYETLLGVSPEGLANAVRHVHASGDSERLCAYREARGFGERMSTVDVVVQEMVRASVAGVAFSHDPQDDTRVRIEAVAGIGEALVSGTAIPESFSVRRSDYSISERSRGRQYIEHVFDGTTRLLTGRNVRAVRLTDSQVVEIARCIVALEAVFPDAARGVDVEWAIDNEGLKLLQCRPITTERDTSTKHARA
jgi:phosphoenolpyruvate synthase/pyruvate phosphate dikinase